MNLGIKLLLGAIGIVVLCVVAVGIILRSSTVGEARSRRRCVSCKYCAITHYHPFRSGKYYWHLTSILPNYCNKLHEYLPRRDGLRCVATVADEVEYDDEED